MKNHLLDPSLAMEFTKEDASAFARLRKGKRAQVRETRRSLEKRSQQLMEQSALLRHDIDTFENELATIGIRNYLTGVAHVCACSLLCPAVWSMLPVGLLQHVFAHLPLPAIIRLRVLSKTWDKCVTGVTPRFTKLCAKRNPNMFALVHEGSKYDGDLGRLVTKLYDGEEKRWIHLFHQIDVFNTCVAIFAGDGGLLCCVCVARDEDVHPLDIVVFNPLSRQWRKLPSSSSLSRIRPRMVQLVKDRDSNCYKVLVVGPKKQGQGNAVARIFSSVTGMWSNPNIFSDLIFGCQYSWYNHGSSDLTLSIKKAGPCAYDCASNTLLELDDGSYPCRFGDQSVLVKDRLFVLHVNHNQEYVLKEYQAQSIQPHWVRLNMHKCYELDAVSGYQEDVDLEFDTQVFGCQGFLLVNVYEESEGEETQCKRTLLFDLSASRWHIISEIPDWFVTVTPRDIFKFRWDAVP